MPNFQAKSDPAESPVFTSVNAINTAKCYAYTAPTKVVPQQTRLALVSTRLIDQPETQAMFSKSSTCWAAFIHCYQWSIISSKIRTSLTVTVIMLTPC